MGDVLQRCLDAVTQAAALATAFMSLAHAVSVLQCGGALTKIGAHRYRGFP